MTTPFDPTPIELKAHGILTLDVLLHPQPNGEVHVRGSLGFDLSKTVDAALSFLPPLVRWGLGSSLVHRELVGNRFRFNVGKLTSFDTELNDLGVLHMSARYQNPLARPVGHSETSKIFRRFARELDRAGLTPGCHEVVEAFIEEFSRKDRGDLPFLQLFEGRAIVTPNGSTQPIYNIELRQYEMTQSKAGDLVVIFEAHGRLEGFEDRLAG